MSSPVSRRSATPRQEGPQQSMDNASSPINNPDDHILSDAPDESPSETRNNNQDGDRTPRANRESQDTSQNPPTSSPLYFQSSPANRSVNRSLPYGTANGVNISSPLRRGTSEIPSEGPRSSRPSNTLMNAGGKWDNVAIT